MTAITGGTHASVVEPGSNVAKVLDAVVACAARWGMAKTTVDDIAREAGVSRATAYRLFPGGKPEMVALATRVEVVTFLAELAEETAAAEDLTDAVTVILSGGSRTLAGHPALAYMRQHQPTAVRAFLSFERLNLLYSAAADVLAPSLERFLEPAAARSTVIWLARIVVSHYLVPDPAAPLTDPAVARHVATTFVLPGLPVGHVPTPSSNTQENPR